MRYAAPLREGGSLPGLIEADDNRMYVVKMRGAGQGALALVAEIITGELARVLGLNVPEILLVELESIFGRNEADPEIRDLLKASAGTNVGLAFLPESTMFDPAAGDRVSAEVASLIVWLDAFSLNVDRSSRNANLLLCREQLWLIDHGASLYVHHDRASMHEKARSPFAPVRDHILLPWAEEVAAASSRAHGLITRQAIERTVQLVPDELLGGEAQERRAEYVRFLTERMASSSVFEEEVQRARAELV